MIKVKDIPQIMELMQKMSATEDLLNKSSLKVSSGYGQSIEGVQDSGLAGQNQLYKDVKKSLQSYRKAIIVELKTYSVDYKAENEDG